MIGCAVNAIRIAKHSVSSDWKRDGRSSTEGDS